MNGSCIASPIKFTHCSDMHRIAMHMRRQSSSHIDVDRRTSEGTVFSNTQNFKDMSTEDREKRSKEFYGKIAATRLARDVMGQQEPWVLDSAMPCNAMPCNAMQRHAMQSPECNAMPCNAMQCRAMPCNAMQCRAMPRRALQKKAKRHRRRRLRAMVLQVSRPSSSLPQPRLPRHYNPQVGSSWWAC